MKRVTTVLILTLILLFSLWGEAYSLSKPYKDPMKPGGFNHPWGGEQVVSDPPPLRAQIDRPGYLSTGITVIDIFINDFIIIKRFRSLLNQRYETKKTNLLRHNRENDNNHIYQTNKSFKGN